MDWCEFSFPVGSGANSQTRMDGTFGERGREIWTTNLERGARDTRRLFRLFYPTRLNISGCQIFAVQYKRALGHVGTINIRSCIVTLVFLLLCCRQSFRFHSLQMEEERERSLLNDFELKTRHDKKCCCFCLYVSWTCSNGQFKTHALDSSQSVPSWSVKARNCPNWMSRSASPTQSFRMNGTEGENSSFKGKLVCFLMGASIGSGTILCYLVYN